MKLELVEYRKDKRADHQCEEPYIRIQQFVAGETLEVILTIIPSEHFTQRFARHDRNLTIDDDDVRTLALIMVERLKQHCLAKAAKADRALKAL